MLFLFKSHVETVEHHLHYRRPVERFRLLAEFGNVNTQVSVEPLEFRVPFKREHIPDELFKFVLVDEVYLGLLLLLQLNLEHLHELLFDEAAIGLQVEAIVLAMFCIHHTNNFIK